MYTLFSADDHIIEPAGVWFDRLPTRFRESGPRVVAEDGREFWIHEGQRGQSVNGSIGNGPPAAADDSVRNKKRPDEERREPFPYTYAEMLPGCYDPAERAKDLFSNGVTASLCFPSLPRFGGTLFLEFQDKTLADLCVRAYNDFILEEWCPGGPEGMFVPMTLCQLWDPDAAAKEVKRCAERGARALSLPENVTHFGLPSFWTDNWDPIWRVCEEAEIPVCMHLGTAGNFEQYRPSPEAPDSVLFAAASVSMSANALLNLVFSPTFTKFPRLKFVLSESGIGWLPYALGRADNIWGRYQGDGFPKQKPSELFRHNMYVCQVEEYIGMKFLDLIGADRVLWELDFPHPDSSWPHAQSHTKKIFEETEVGDEAIELITHRNSEALFRWTPAEMPKAIAV